MSPKRHAPAASDCAQPPNLSDRKTPRSRISSQPGIYNYFTGNDAAKWTKNVPGYAEVVYRGIWDGVDFRLSGNGPDLEQEFIVAPGGDLSQVRIAYKGIDSLKVADDGSLIILTAFGELRESRPKCTRKSTVSGSP
jgi:hypothetical protein